MSDGPMTCWDCERFSFDDLPKFQDLIEAADTDMLISTALKSRYIGSADMHPCDRCPSNRSAHGRPVHGRRTHDKHAHDRRAHGRHICSRKKPDRIRARMESAIRQMRNMKCRKGSGHLVFIPTDFYWAEQKDVICHTVDAELVDIADMVRANNILETFGTNSGAMHVRSDFQTAMSCHTPVRFPDDDRCPRRRPFELIAWRKALQYRVWIPERYCRKERYMFLASILNELTYLGFDAHETRVRQKQVLAGIAAHASHSHLEDRKPTSVTDPAPDKNRTPLEFFFRAYGLSPPHDDSDNMCLHKRIVVAESLNQSARIDLLEEFVDLGRRCGIIASSQTGS